jgi:hypothetical protein
MKTFVFLRDFDRQPTDRCFLYACYGNPYSFLVWLERRERRRHTKQGRPRDPFPPPQPRQRRSLPAVHREVARWLRHQAVLWWVTTDRFIERFSHRI